MSPQKHRAARAGWKKLVDRGPAIRELSPASGSFWSSTSGAGVSHKPSANPTALPGGRGLPSVAPLPEGRCGRLPASVGAAGKRLPQFGAAAWALNFSTGWKVHIAAVELNAQKAGGDC